MIEYQPLSGKKILVTGASAGIGKKIALLLAKSGAILILAGRNSDRLQETLNEIGGTGNISYTGDLSLDSSINELASICPTLDGVVHNAGMIKTCPVSFISREDLLSVFNINFFSPVLLTKALLSQKKVNKSASIVFMSSIGGNLIGTPGLGIYGSTKSAMIGMAKVMAIELSPKKIRVNCICPGMVDTDILAHGNIITNEQLDIDKKKYPLGYGNPGDVAETCLFLLSDGSKWMTGSSLILDGGFSIQ